MINLYDYKNELKYFLDIVNKIFDIDYALFDVESNLIISTETYLKIKGMIVHAPSIQEVVMKGTVTVNNPGYMAACIGCRFIRNCPSTIEILNSIKTSTESYGVLAFTSFSKEGHDKIVNNIDFYTNIIEQFSNLVSLFIMQKYSNDSNISKSFLTAVLELSDDGFITTDANGNIEVINTSALEFFSSCGMLTKSIYQLFPDNIISIILSGRLISNYKIKINNLLVSIFSTPIRNNDIILGFAIKICYNKSLAAAGLPLKQKNDLPYSLDSIKGKSKHIHDIKRVISKLSNSPSTIFISGETGTGKGLLAKTIHFESKRRNSPFITINCTSIPESLFESEMFGYEPGAFTGANKEGKPGKFELANGGTLFLDEVSEIPINVQAKLLSVLQDSSFERVGGITPINVDVRIIAASNRKIDEMIENKEFRSDLFYRLNVIPINLIPLRERKEDINILSNDFLQHYNKKLKRQVLGFDSKVSKMFNSSNWPGNIRQLENVIEYCINMTNNDVITVEDLPNDFINITTNLNQTSNNKIKESERIILIETIDKYGWNVKGKTMAAKELGMGLRTLYRKLNEVK